MGNGSDYSDIERFLNSPGGCEHLNMVRRSILGKTIADVRFENNTRNVKTLLIMDNGSRFYCVQPCHDVEAIRELFGCGMKQDQLSTGG